MGLVLTRHEGEKIILSVQDGADEQQLIEALRNSGISISISQAKFGAAKVRIDAPDAIKIMREELINVPRSEPNGQ
ncbi:carbon storage regulator CsrA [Pseudomonas duriflava]|uniref:Carbon storage regulator CsrA n=1 Tax=Pseudomonas duriflava TaxID=459528 RepID=A0A562PU96_9PSED|nr:carbon storage regulator [Pseudomonas duriflava]TWI48022.1 carbon storage regulator CsrA [Pseudomonas duriflava]